MSLVLSPPKILLLAVEFAAKADIDGLRHLAGRHEGILRKDILLRVLLTYLPEALPSSKYVGFVEEIERGEYSENDYGDIESSAVDELSDQEAAKKVRKLHLLQLSSPETPPEAAEDPTAQFLLRRAYKVDEEAGLLDSLPDLLVPFLDHSPCIRTLMVSAILPLLRRNFEYYPASPLAQTLYSFQHLPDRTAVSLLLEQTGEAADNNNTSIGRDLRGLVGPWLYNEKRWATRNNESNEGETAQDPSSTGTEQQLCPGWAEVLDWLTTKASKSWRVAVSAIDQWDGPDDVDLGGYGAMWLSEQEQEHLERTYARAALASAYLIPEASQEALSGAHSIITKIMGLLDQDPGSPLQSAASILPPISAQDLGSLLNEKSATWLRNDLLQESNPLTAPTRSATQLLYALTLSAYLLTKNGVPCTVRRAGELALLQDERDQKSVAANLIHSLGNNGPKSDDKYWIKARNDILWLRDWGSEEAGASTGQQLSGVFGQLKREYLEVEILKALLANTRYTLARSLYEDSPDKPLSKKVLQDTILAAAYNAFDNASNPNRTRGGLKKCDDILKSFPKTIDKSLPATKRIEALLKATHALSEFRIVLKQGEPFTPVLLRVHQDPIAIVGKILEQNPKSYTRLHDLVDLGANMVAAGLTAKSSPSPSTSSRRGSTTTTTNAPTSPTLTPEQELAERTTAERRITAMCIDASLTEDDFETAYSYVTNRLSSLSPPPPSSSSSSSSPSQAYTPDTYSWRAALQAGKYRRTPRTLRPTHPSGFAASANPEIRHLEQRIDCLSTALRIAPAPTLTEILNAFRRAEEELVAALAAEAEMESAWDERGDAGLGVGMPGGFAGVAGAAAGQAKRQTVGAGSAGPKTRARRDSVGLAGHQTEEKPMSLFDLSRASVASAQRNLTALSSLQRSGLGRLTGFASGGGGGGAGASKALSATSGGSEDESGAAAEAKRVRKRDQLREAAMGSLVSGVGWLIGADNTAAHQGGGGGHEER